MAAILVWLMMTTTLAATQLSSGFVARLERRDAAISVSDRISRSHARAKRLAGHGVSLEDSAGVYTMEVKIGTPPQALRAILDTGSDLFWVQCGDGEMDFNPTASSTFRTIRCRDALCRLVPYTCVRSQCMYDFVYGGGAETGGRLATETLTFATNGSSSQQISGIAFGCGDHNYGFEDFDGVVGFGRDRISFLTQISAGSSGIRRKFAYCLAPNSSQLFYGDSASSVISSHTQYTPLINVTNNPDPNYFYVRLSEFRIGSTNIRSYGDTVIDCGTTLTYVPDSVYESIAVALDQHVNLPSVDGDLIGLSPCYNTSTSPNYTFPSMEISFGGAVMMLPRENYLIFPDENLFPGVVCLAVVSNEGGISVIGNIMQQNYHVLYDLENSTLAFTPTKCSTL